MQVSVTICPHVMDFALAMGICTMAAFEHVYEPDRALQVGTIFPELNKPFYGRKGMRG